MRTTSSVEAINSSVQRDFPGKTNIFKFTDSLKLYESEKSSDLHCLSKETNLDKQLQRRRKEDRIRDAKIKANTDLLKVGAITAIEFLEAMAVKEVLPESGRNILISL